MSRRRVVVTGMGVVTPLGNTLKESWEAVKTGKSGVALVDAFETEDFGVRIAAMVKNFDPQVAMTAKDMRRVDTFIQYGCVAAKEAIDHSGISLNDEESLRAGVAVGAGIGGLPWIEKAHLLLLEGGVRKISPFFIPAAIINEAAGYISMYHKLRGPNIAINTACATGTHNIGHAARIIAYGDADVMVAGGTEMATTRLGLGGFAASRALSTRNDEPEKASRPWDRDRDGFVMGEGAGVLVLEELEYAKKRGATIYAEVIGFGMSADAYHVTLPDPDAIGAVMTMKNAIRDAKLNLDQIDYINAHGTSTKANDITETRAMKEVFGDEAYKLAISSTKSMTGHLLGAAGAVEAIFSVMAIKDQLAPPTINLDHPDEGCDLDYIPHHAREMKIDTVLSNSFGFGGTNSTLIFKKFAG